MRYHYNEALYIITFVISFIFSFFPLGLRGLILLFVVEPYHYYALEIPAAHALPFATL